MQKFLVERCLLIIHSTMVFGSKFQYFFFQVKKREMKLKLAILHGG